MRLDLDGYLLRREAIPELKRAELINGAVHMPPTVGESHGCPDSLLGMWLGVYAAGTPGTRSGTSLTWLMPPDNALEPDQCLFVPPGYGGRAERHDRLLFGAPELAAETSVTTVAKDLGLKFDLFRNRGARIYRLNAGSAGNALARLASGRV